MAYKIYKLTFEGPCHFGAIQGAAGLERSLTYCLSDTFFGALANEAVNLYGQDGINRLIESVETNQLTFSDLFPYRDRGDLYLPRPILPANYKDNTELGMEVMARGKELKTIKFIPAYLYVEYIESVRDSRLLEFFDDELTLSALTDVNTRVNLQGQDSLPYSVGKVVYPQDSGLYCLVKANDDFDFEWLTGLIESLGYSGIGGKRSSGYGRFRVDVDDLDEDLSDLLNQEEGRAVSLSTVIPSPSELDVFESGYYSLIARGGFVVSRNYSRNVKKRNRYFAVESGSTFAHPLQGDLIDVGDGSGHPVYRMGKGLFIKVDA